MDSRSIFIPIAVLVIANSAVLATIQRDLPPDLRPAVRRWQIATLIIPISSGLFAFRTGLPTDFVVAVSNAAFVVGLTFHLWAIERFFRCSPSTLPLWVCLVTMLIVTACLLADATVMLRAILVSFCWLTILSHTAWTLQRHREASPSRSQLMLLSIYLIVIGFVVLRSVHYYLDGTTPVTVVFHNALINIVSPIIMALLTIVGTTAFTLMCLDRVRRQLECAATTDHLTALGNRRTLDINGPELAARSRAGEGVFAVVIFDIDRFKVVNDTHGHAAGDKVIQFVADHLRTVARTGDTVSRSGGEEFVLLLAKSGLDGAVAAAERIRLAVRAHPCIVGDTGISLTISAGIACFDDSDVDFEAVMRRADRALYRAKNLGRDRVEVDIVDLGNVKRINRHTIPDGIVKAIGKPA